jgi:hypothetical protein
MKNKLNLDAMSIYELWQPPLLSVNLLDHLQANPLLTKSFFALCWGGDCGWPHWPAIQPRERPVEGEATPRSAGLKTLRNY